MPPSSGVVTTLAGGVAAFVDGTGTGASFIFPSGVAVDAAGNVVNGEISRAAKYYVYNILHSVPRKANPSGTMDNDQYLIKIVTPARNTAFEQGFIKMLNDFGNYDCGTAITVTV